jgi:N-methylhydantoinase A
MFCIGVDIGGTFTDFTVYDRRTGRVTVEKCLSTPKEPARGVIQGLNVLAEKIPGLEAQCERFNHATTLVTNAILERKGARTALLATKGFRDILEQRLEFRYTVYDLFITFPEPVVPRDLRYGITERVYSDGAVLKPLDEAEVIAVAQELRQRDVSAVAICYLHSYRNSAHERRTAEILAEYLPGVPVSMSHEVNPEPREYDRTSTTVLDAYVKPVVDAYLDRLSTELSERGMKQDLEVMLSNGASTTASIARKFPIQLIESGPAAGVEAAIWMCAQAGIGDALSFDMGGTTAKLCVIRDGMAGRARKFETGRVHRFVAGSGMPVAVPVYDLVEIGAGGGSIARIDDLGLIAVGPDSAGAEPGPACYGRGGTLPTITDADLMLGLLDPDYFLGGEMKLNAAAGERAVASLAKSLGIEPVLAAYGIFDIVNETMASAARLHIAEKGRDPTKLTVIAFGGAGPVHAIELARKLGCPRVVFPPYAGVMSSFGLLTAPPAFERTRSVKRLLNDLTPNDIVADLDFIKQDVLQTLQASAQVRFRFTAEMWHQGQEYPLEVNFRDADLGPDLVGTLAKRFRALYHELYGRSDEETPVEVSSLRAIGELPDQRVVQPQTFFSETGCLFGTRRIYDRARNSFIEVDVYNRMALAPRTEISGPAVIQERESGFVIRDGDRLRVHESGAVFVDLA